MNHRGNAIHVRSLVFRPERSKPRRPEDRFGPTTPQSGTRAGVRLAAIGKVVKRASPWGGFRERPGHKPLDLLLLNPISRFGDGPRGTVGPQGRDSRRRGGCDADDPQDGSGELLARQGPVPRHAQRVPLDPQEVGEVGRRHPRRATAAQGHPRVPRLGLRTSRQGRGRRTQAARPTRPASTSAPSSPGPGSRS